MEWGAAALDLDLRGGRRDVSVGIVHEFQDLAGLRPFSAPLWGPTAAWLPCSSLPGDAQLVMQMELKS